MCTVVVLRRSDHPWPLLLAGNRDEMADRPWSAPARHWPDRPEVIGGLDVLAGGSWLGLNDHGLVAAVLNRYGTLGPAAGKRSRGELVLEALDHADAVLAAEALGALDARSYRAFNMVIADNRDAFWIRADGVAVRIVPLPEGVSMLTAFDLNDPADPRIRAFLPQFRASPAPEPEKNDWQGWQSLLGHPAQPGSHEREAGLSFQLENGFGTRSSALIALPAIGLNDDRPHFLFAPGPPDRTEFAPIDL